MKHGCTVFIATMISVGFSLSAGAVYNATVDGTVTYVSQMGPGSGFSDGTVAFALSSQPANACQANGFRQFVISPVSVADADTRRNMIALVLTAKASGAQLRVAYDQNGGWCDQNSLAVHWLSVM